MYLFLIFISKIFFTSKVLFYLYPFFKLFYKKNLLEKIIHVHNKIILKKIKNIDKILIILPHCIQNSNCTYRVTGSLIDNCRYCKRCQVCDFLNLRKSNLKIIVYIATGGTVARQIVMQSRADFILAIACEKDLISGIKDIKKIPTVLMLNQRPNGPCKDTVVDFEEIKLLLKNISNNF